jgi:hypothetical protein
MSRSRNTLRRAIIHIEAAVSLVLLIALGVTMAKAIHAYHNAQVHSLAARSALWAADAQLQRIRTGAAAGSRPPADLVPNTIELKSKIEPGRGEWEGFNRVTVIATVSLAQSRPVQEQAVGYVRGGGGS